MQVTLASQNRLALEHLSKDAACTPQVYCRRVFSELKKQLRRPVPSSYDQGRVFSPRLAVAPASLGHRFVVVSCKTKIRYLESSTVVDEEVGGFHVSVEDVVVVEVAQTLEQL